MQLEKQSSHDDSFKLGNGVKIQMGRYKQRNEWQDDCNNRMYIICTKIITLPYLRYIYMIFNLLIDFPGWLLAKERAYCSGTETGKGYTPTVSHCAKECKGVGDFFATGTTDHGYTQCAGSDCCTSQGCRCYCYSGSSGSCSPNTHDAYNAYKYSDEKERKYTEPSKLRAIYYYF